MRVNRIHIHALSVHGLSADLKFEVRIPDIHHHLCTCRLQEVTYTMTKMDLSLLRGTCHHCGCSKTASCLPRKDVVE